LVMNGPMSSYTSVDVKMMATIKAPIGAVASCSPKMAALLVAKPIATPACGIKAKPKYFLTVGSALVIRAPVKAPLHLPAAREKI